MTSFPLRAPKGFEAKAHQTDQGNWGVSYRPIGRDWWTRADTMTVPDDVKGEQLVKHHIAREARDQQEVLHEMHADMDRWGTE